MSLYKNIAKNIDSAIGEFCKIIADKYNLDENILKTIWTDSNHGSLMSKPRKRTAYIEFQNKIRPLIKTEMPDLSFGEISKEISKRWNSLSKEEQDRYKTTDTPVSSPIKAPLSKFKVQELKSMCKKKGLKTNGKKNDLIERLQNHEENLRSGSPVRSPVGSEVRSPVGSEVRSPVGSEVRSPVGTEVGSPVGSEVGSPVGSEVGSPVGSEVGSPVGSEVGSPDIEIGSVSEIGSPDGSIRSTADTDKTPSVIATPPINSSTKNYKSLKISDLKILCKKRGIDEKGDKNKLIEKLMLDDEEDGVKNGTPMSIVSVNEDYDSMTLAELKKLCREKNIDDKGGKKKLVENLKKNKK